MVFQSFPSATNSEVIKAELASLQVCPTPRGDRFYGVFQLPDGKSIGIWTDANDSISQLKPGDKALFRHRHGSSYEFIATAS